MKSSARFREFRNEVNLVFIHDAIKLFTKHQRNVVKIEQMHWENLFKS